HAAFLHGRGDIVWCGLIGVRLLFHKFKDEFVRRTFHLEAFLNVIKKIFGAFVGYSEDARDLFKGFDFIFWGHDRLSSARFANTAATSMRYSADAHSSLAS